MLVLGIFIKNLVKVVYRLLKFIIIINRLRLFVGVILKLIVFMFILKDLIWFDSKMVLEFDNVVV